MKGLLKAEPSERPTMEEAMKHPWLTKDAPRRRQPQSPEKDEGIVDKVSFFILLVHRAVLLLIWFNGTQQRATLSGIDIHVCRQESALSPPRFAFLESLNHFVTLGFRVAKYDLV